jgi:tripartite motif-containing protein 71
VVLIAGGLGRPPMSRRYADGEYRNDLGVAGKVADQRWRDTRQRTLNGEIKGDGDDGWRFLYDSAVDGDGRVLVLDGHRVKIFDIDGNHLLSFGAAGWDEEDFVSPCGLAVDSKDHVMVTDNATRNPHEKDAPPRNQVKVFDSNGEFQFSLGPFGSGDRNLKLALGVAVDSTTASSSPTRPATES